MSTFDPAAHLTKQGWKGKGTALKHGHATRPLPVVPKKTLTGIGKDRDTAVPFWDHIFASTASTLFSPSTPTTSSSWQTLEFGVHPSQRKPAMSATARSRREVARRGLYSRFFKGTALSEEHTPVEEEEEVVVVVEKAESVEGMGKGKGKEWEG
ncbi:hypothetical protein P7C73_g6118, partial [Tremellales sp. Uapishka_1]